MDAGAHRETVAITGTSRLTARVTGGRQQELNHPTGDGRLTSHDIERAVLVSVCGGVDTLTAPALHR